MKSSRLGRIALLAIGELARQIGDVERALAPGQVARLARRLARRRRLDHLGDDRAWRRPDAPRTIASSLSATMPSTTGRTSEETSLSLVCEENFGSGTLTESTQVRPSRSRRRSASTFSFLAMPLSFGVAVDLARQRRAEAGEMRAAVALRDVVGEAQHRSRDSCRSTASRPRR